MSLTAVAVPLAGRSGDQRRPHHEEAALALLAVDRLEEQEHRGAVPVGALGVLTSVRHLLILVEQFTEAVALSSKAAKSAALSLPLARLPSCRHTTTSGSVCVIRSGEEGMRRAGNSGRHAIDSCGRPPGQPRRRHRMLAAIGLGAGGRIEKKN